MSDVRGHGRIAHRSALRMREFYPLAFFQRTRRWFFHPASLALSETRFSRSASSVSSLKSRSQKITLQFDTARQKESHEFTRQLWLDVKGLDHRSEEQPSELQSRF